MQQLGFLLVLLSGVACQQPDLHAPVVLSDGLVAACAVPDVGAVLTMVDREYSDDRGGPGRLADDLRQLFTVYGPLNLEVMDLEQGKDVLSGHLQVEGKGLLFEGPMVWRTVDQPTACFLAGDFLTELRAVVWLLRDRRRALEEGSLERLGELISLEYRGEVGGWKELLERTRLDLAASKGVGMMVHDLRVVVQGGSAQVTQAYMLIYRIGEEGKLMEQKARERLQLRKEGTRWRIVGGLG